MLGSLKEGEDSMKEFDKTAECISEFDFDTFANEMEILLGSQLGVRNIVSNHMDTNTTCYSEASHAPCFLENEDEVKEANNRFRLMPVPADINRFPQ